MKDYIVVFLVSCLVGAGYCYRDLLLPSSGCVTTKEDRDFNSLGASLLTYQKRVGHLPTTKQGLKALVERPAVPPLPKRWKAMMKEVPSDRWGRAYRYIRLPDCDPGRFEIWSAGKDGIDGTEDDISSRPPE